MVFGDKTQDTKFTYIDLLEIHHHAIDIYKTNLSKLHYPFFHKAVDGFMPALLNAGADGRAWD